VLTGTLALPQHATEVLAASPRLLVDKIDRGLEVSEEPAATLLINLLIGQLLKLLNKMLQLLGVLEQALAVIRRAQFEGPANVLLLAPKLCRTVRHCNLEMRLERVRTRAAHEGAIDFVDVLEINRAVEQLVRLIPRNLVKFLAVDKSPFPRLFSDNKAFEHKPATAPWVVSKRSRAACHMRTQGDAAAPAI
jgi:hypothetical protein